MEFAEAKDKFIQAWGSLGSSWGINRTMAQIHALLLISPVELNAEDIMSELKISRGNANMNLRALMDWGLVHKEMKTGERKEFFVAEKNMMTVVRNIVTQRKKRELEPMLDILKGLTNVEGNSPEAAEFTKVIRDVQLFSQKADATLENLTKADANWLISSLFKVIK